MVLNNFFGVSFVFNIRIIIFYNLTLYEIMVRKGFFGAKFHTMAIRKSNVKGSYK